MYKVIRIPCWAFDRVVVKVEQRRHPSKAMAAGFVISNS
jgi:hypothetical protein